MENLIKPVDYAAKMGISRQAVYAKIKKGILPSRNVGGKIYIVLEEEPQSPEADNHSGAESHNAGKLLEAKDETIAVLKETIRDLKETNQMITTTLRSEVELLKEAFGEMKTLYAAQIEHIRQKESTHIPLAEIEENELDRTEIPVEEEPSPRRAEVRDREEPFISLDQFLEEQGIRKKKLRKRLESLARERLEKGKKGFRSEDGRIELSPEKAAKILEKALKDKV